MNGTPLRWDAFFWMFCVFGYIRLIPDSVVFLTTNHFSEQSSAFLSSLQIF